MAESIPVWMGSFQGRSTICNKRGRIETAGGGWVFRADSLHGGDMIPYGDFDPLNARFVCDTYYNVNFGFFKYKDIYYDGYITVSTLSEGLYQYSFTIDPISTCWDNGCFDCMNFVEYADYKNLIGISGNRIDRTLTPDPRFANEAVPTRQLFTVDTTINYNSWVVLVLSNPILGTTDGTIDQADGEWDGENITDPGDHMYIMNQKAYWELYKNLMDTKPIWDIWGKGYTRTAQKIIAQCVKRVYYVPEYVKNDLLSAGNLFTQPSVAFRFVYAFEWLGIESNDLGIRQVNVPVGEQGSVLYGINLEYTRNCPVHSVDTSGLSSDLKYVLNGMITIDQPLVGSIKFTPSKLGLKTLDSVGFRNKYNITGGTFESHLVVNGIDYYQYKATGVVSSTMPIVIFDEGATNSQNPSAVGNSIAQLVGNTPTNTKIPESAGMILGGLSTGFQLGQMIGQIPQGNYAGVYSAGSGLGGGAMWGYGTTPTQIEFLYTKKIKDSTSSNWYGDPYFGMANLSQLSTVANYSGYCKTKDCHLKMKQLPYSIVSSAESQCDQGVYLGIGPVD